MLKLILISLIYRKSTIIRLSYFTLQGNLVLDGRLRESIPTKDLQTDLKPLNLKIVTDITDYINEALTANQLLKGIPGKDKIDQIIGDLQTAWSDVINGSLVEVVKYQQYISINSQELTGVLYKITVGGQTRNPKLFRAPVIASDLAYTGNDVLKINKLYKLSLNGLILSGDAREIVKQQIFTRVWFDYLQLRSNRDSLEITFYKSDVNFGLVGEVVSTILYSVTTNNILYHPGIKSPVTETATFLQAVTSVVPEAQFFGSSRTLIRRDRTFSIIIEKQLTKEDISTIKTELSTEWSGIEPALDELPKVIGITESTDSQMK